MKSLIFVSLLAAGSASADICHPVSALFELETITDKTREGPAWFAFGGQIHQGKLTARIFVYDPVTSDPTRISYEFVGPTGSLSMKGYLKRSDTKAISDVKKLASVELVAKGRLGGKRIRSNLIPLTGVLDTNTGQEIYLTQSDGIFCQGI